MTRADPRMLTPKQEAFVREYLVDLNASAAARRAGYSERTAGRIGNENVLKPVIASAIAAAQAKRARRTEITADRVLKELARIAFADVRNLFEWDEERAVYVPSRGLTDDQAAAVSAVKAKTTRFTSEDGVEQERIELELKTYDKLSALEKIGKHIGMFIERSEHRQTGEVTVRFIRE